MDNNQYLEKYPVGRTVIRRWAEADQAALSRAFGKITDHWAWSADARHFWQFAEAAEIAALDSLTPEEAEALLGWGEEEYALGQ